MFPSLKRVKMRSHLPVWHHLAATPKWYPSSPVANQPDPNQMAAWQAGHVSLKFQQSQTPEPLPMHVCDKFIYSLHLVFTQKSEQAGSADNPDGGDVSITIWCQILPSAFSGWTVKGTVMIRAAYLSVILSVLPSLNSTVTVLQAQIFLAYDFDSLVQVCKTAVHVSPLLIQ